MTKGGSWFQAYWLPVLWFGLLRRLFSSLNGPGGERMGIASRRLVYTCKLLMYNMHLNKHVLAPRYLIV